MSTSNPTRRTLAVLASVAGLTAAAWSPVGAQGLTPDPYNIVGEGNSQYEPYMYASQPNQPGTVPNQMRYSGRAVAGRSGNRFNEMDSLDGLDPGEAGLAPARRTGAGVPYYQAFRQYDRSFDRLYRPNKDADGSFYARQDERNKLYFEAVRARDPRKRAQLMRDFNLKNLGTDLGAKPSTERGAKPAAPAAGDGDPNRRLSAPGTSRTSLPLPGRTSARAVTGRSGATTPSAPAGRAVSPGRVTPAVPGVRDNSARSTPSTPNVDDLMERARRTIAPRNSTPPPPR